MKGSVKLPVFIDDARKYVNTTQLRAKYLGASYEAEYCQWQTLHGLGSLMETASLIITPNAYLEGKLIASYPPDPIGDFDVVRATTATRVNSAGLVELVPYNLLSYSQDFANNSVWTSYNSTINSNTTTAPDGTTTADSIVLTSGYGSRYQSFTFSSSLATISAYFKKVDFAEVYIDAGGTGAYFGASFNLDTQSTTLFGVASSAVVESVGNGWYRCSVVAVADGTKNLAFGIYGGVGGNSVYVWGAQANLGTIKPYQKTETRLNIPRLDYSNGTCPSLLVEPQRTNRIVYSSSFDNGAWSAIDTTISANTTISPEGIQNADTMAISSSTSRIFQYTGLGAGTYTASVYVKALSGTPTIQFRMVVDGADITDSIPTTTEWVRHDFTFTASASMDYFVLRGESGTGSVAIWGAQLEVGNYASSYIPTTSASVTRNADVISKTGISSLIGQTEGTIFWNAQKNLDGVDARLNLSDGTTNNWIFVGIEADNRPRIYCNVGGTNQFSIYGTQLSNDFHKLAFTYKANDFALYIDGVQVITHTSGSVPACSRIDVAALYAGSGSATICNNKAVALWKTRLTNTQLAQLTSI